jgi:AraC-like DNA-binding protein
MSSEIRIKNMVCQRCVSAVSDVFQKLQIPVQRIELGGVWIDFFLTQEMKNTLSQELKALGFELLEDQNAKIISQIKDFIIEEIQHNDSKRNENFSTLIAQKLHHDYSHLSRLFSTVEGITIEKFITKQKIEKVKELISYGELSLSEISDLMDYSSVAYLSSQFKKETGMTPSEFKKLNSKPRTFLDKV